MMRRLPVASALRATPDMAQARRADSASLPSGRAGGRAGLALAFVLVLAAACGAPAPAGAQWNPKTSCDPLGGYELENCLGKELGEADKALNDAYQKTLAAIAASGRPDAQKTAWRENLVAAQRDWLTYRDANCKFELIGAEWNFGSGTTSAQQQCVLALTQARTAELVARSTSN